MSSGRKSAPPIFHRPDSGFSVVEGNIRCSSAVPRHRHRKALSIDEAPMMLLPKARVRDNMDFFFQYRKSYGVVADTETQGLHITTIQPVDSMQLRPATKSSLKASSRRCSSSMARSEADSGIGSLKRSVTFENLSASGSTTYRSDDELDEWSNMSTEENREISKTVSSQIHNDEGSSLTVRLPRLGAGDTEDDSRGEVPEHLDTFGDNVPVIADIPTKRKPVLIKKVSYPRASSSKKRFKHGGVPCEICGMDLSDEQKVRKTFEKSGSFMDWVMSKWGKRRELQFIPSPTFVYRGKVPHFCNFVRQLPLHSKLQNGTDSTGLPEDSELGDEIDLIAESVDGSQIGQWRKGSNASSNGMLFEPPRLETYESPVSEDSIPEQKEDVMTSGTEGRPGSPSSVGENDNPDIDDDDDKMTSSPVTGVEVRVTPSRSRSDSSLRYKMESSASYIERDEGIELSRPDDNMTIPEVVTPPPPATPTDAWNMNIQKSRRDSHTTEKHSSDVLIPSGHSTDDNGERAESPRQPPPTPEPKPPETPPPQKRRACVSKKVKKQTERVRKKKEMEIPPEPQPQKVEDVEIAPPVDDESSKADGKIELKVPDLPSSTDKKERHQSAQHKINKQLIQIENEFDPFRPDPSDLLDDRLRAQREVDWTGMETNGLDDIKRPPQIKSWIQGRLALSQQSSRFELPMDMKKLETMTPQEYVKNHCVITSRRQNLYQKIFLKNKDKSATILYKDLDKTLKDVLVNTITSEQIEEILKLLEITEHTRVDYKLFAGLAAYSERILYPKFVTEDTQDMPEYQREKIECADFSALDWKFHGIKVNPAMSEVLRRIS